MVSADKVLRLHYRHKLAYGNDRRRIKSN